VAPVTNGLDDTLISVPFGILKDGIGEVQL